MHTTTVRGAWTSNLMILKARVFTLLPLVQSRSCVLLLWIVWFFRVFKSKNRPRENVIYSTKPVKSKIFHLSYLMLNSILHWVDKVVRLNFQVLIVLFHSLILIWVNVLVLKQSILTLTQRILLVNLLTKLSLLNMNCNKDGYELIMEWYACI